MIYLLQFLVLAFQIVIFTTQRKTMSKIAEFAARQAAFNERLRTDLTAIAANIGNLNTLIQQLQNSPGEITAEDQAVLDQLETAAGDLATQADSLAGATPPAPPSTTDEGPADNSTESLRSE